MTTFASQYLQNARLNWIRGTAYPAAPATVYLALFTVAPVPAGTGGTEVSGGAYARQSITCNTSNFSAPATSGNAQQTKNANQVNFPTATANWGTVVGIGIYDAASAGNLLWYGDLTSSQTVNNGFQFVIAINNLVVQED